MLTSEFQLFLLIASLFNILRWFNQMIRRVNGPGRHGQQARGRGGWLRGWVIYKKMTRNYLWNWCFINIVDFFFQTKMDIWGKIVVLYLY
jgi:hypothetical protein